MIILITFLSILIMVSAKITILIKMKVDKFPEHLCKFLKVKGGAKSKIK